MPKPKKKTGRRPAAKTPSFPLSPLAPQVLEQAAQGWLQSAGTAPRPSPRPDPGPADHRLTSAVAALLQELRAEIAELRSRLERLEGR